MSIIEIWGQIILCWGAGKEAALCISGCLAALDTGSTLTPSYSNNKMSPDIANYSLWGKINPMRAKLKAEE